MFEERKLDVGAEIFRRLRIELHIAQVAAVAARPSAMHPRPFHQRRRRVGIEFADGVERLVGPAQVFGVVPAAHHQHRAVHVLHVPRQVARLPVGVVGVVLHLVVEQPVGALQIELVEVGDVPRLQIELVAVLGAKIERRGRLGRLRLALRAKRNIEPEVGRKHESSAVVGIVAHEQVGHGRLRAGRHQRRMRIDDRSRGVEPRIRNAPDAHLAVVVGHVFQQELDRVVGVGSVVHILRRLLVIDVRPHLDEIRPRSSSARAHPGRRRYIPTFWNSSDGPRRCGYWSSP